MSEKIQQASVEAAMLFAMELDHGLCYRALEARDKRFDGRFFTGVTSTGVYCRPVCPARTPKADNCRFFACAAAAEEAGFRPCLRCRPETSPGTPAWRGTSATVSRALRLIEEGALDRAGVDELSARLGLGDRHLRRLFNEQLGASPLAVATTRRVHFAKRLIESSALPMTQVALASGYQTVRRFNAAIRRSFDRTPTQIRRQAQEVDRPADGGSITLRFTYRQPYDWAGMLRYLSPRAIPGVEEIRGEVYRRTVELEDPEGCRPFVIEVEPDPSGRPALQLRAPVEAAICLSQVADRARALFDLDADPDVIFGQLARHSRLAPIVTRHPGLRVPGAWDRFELALRVVLGQQVSVAAASSLAGRLVRAFGRPLPGPDEGSLAWLFPRPVDLVEADLADLGMPRGRAQTIRGLARAICDGAPILELSPSLDEAIQELLALPGVGDWTAQCVAMRALREPDACPAGDLLLRKALAEEGEGLQTAAEVRRLAEAWRPWRAYAAMLLWRDAASASDQKEASS